MKPTRSINREALGLGLRTVHYNEIWRNAPDVDYFEIISENFMGVEEYPRMNLGRVLASYPVVLHGVGLNLLGHESFDEGYLERLCRLVEFVQPAFVSDHLCWTGAHCLSHHDLLPTPYTRDLVGYAAERADYVQKRLGVPFALENLSSYVSFTTSEMAEWEFYSAIVDQAGIYFMLDLNNIYVSSQNHSFDPLVYMQHIDFKKVLQVHLAGHERLPDGAIIDTHDRAVDDAVWQLYKHAWQRWGPFPTLLEWDASIPSLAVLTAELHKAKEVRT